MPKMPAIRFNGKKIAVNTAMATEFMPICSTCKARSSKFGATLLFAGSLVAVTQTAPLAIFSRFSDPNGFNQAIALSVVLIIVSAALLMAVKLTGGDRTLEGRGL